MTAPWQEQTHAYTVVVASAASVQHFNLADNVFARNSHCVGITVKNVGFTKDSEHLFIFHITGSALLSFFPVFTEKD